MHKMIPAALALILAPTLTVTAFRIRAEEAHAGAGTQWTYAGATGPEHWGELDTEFTICASGVNQSPIDIQSALDVDLPPLRIRYVGKGTEILNNGHTIQVNVAPGSILTRSSTPRHQSTI
jgi:carbonic anhydrase